MLSNIRLAVLEPISSTLKYAQRTYIFWFIFRGFAYFPLSARLCSWQLLLFYSGNGRREPDSLHEYFPRFSTHCHLQTPPTLSDSD